MVAVNLKGENLFVTSIFLFCLNLLFTLTELWLTHIVCVEANPLIYCFNECKWTEQTLISIASYKSLLCVLLISAQQSRCHFSCAEQDCQTQIHVQSYCAAKVCVQLPTMCTESIKPIRLKKMGMKMSPVSFSFQNKTVFLNPCGQLKILGNKVPCIYLFLARQPAMQSIIYNSINQRIQTILGCFHWIFLLLALCN